MPGSERKTILFINHWGDGMGGAEHSLLDMLLFMAPRCDCHLVTSEDGRLVARARKAGVVCHIVPCGMKPTRFLRNRLLSTFVLSPSVVTSFLRHVVGISRLVRKLRPMLVHANVPKSHMALCCLPRLGYRGWCCFHMREIFSKGTLPALLYQTLLPRKQSIVIAISHSVQSSLPEHVGKRSTVIYNGVMVRSQPRPYQNPGAGMRLLYCGRIVPWKGCHVLVEMFADFRVRCKTAPVTLTLAGDTSYWPQQYRTHLAETIRRKGLDSCCRLLQNTDDVQALYAAHDVFVNASEREPFGRSIAEAQGAGLAVVSFDSGGVSEIVVDGTTGFLAPYGDGSMFVGSLVKLFECKGLAARMGEAGRIRAEALFNRDEQVRKQCEFLLAGRP